MASTNWDTDRKRRRPPAWDPPKLLLVVGGGLRVEVGTLGAVRIVEGGVWLLGSSIWLHQPGTERGRPSCAPQCSNHKGFAGTQNPTATMSTHPKYSQARIYTKYALVSMKCVVSVD